MQKRADISESRCEIKSDTEWKGQAGTEGCKASCGVVFSGLKQLNRVSYMRFVSWMHKNIWGLALRATVIRSCTRTELDFVTCLKLSTQFHWGFFTLIFFLILLVSSFLQTPKCVYHLFCSYQALCNSVFVALIKQPVDPGSHSRNYTYYDFLFHLLNEARIDLDKSSCNQ